MDSLRFLVSHAGDSHLLTVPRGTSFPELRATMEDLFGSGRGATLQCQLPGMGAPGDLVTIRSDGDLASLVQNYEPACRDSGCAPGSRLNIRAFLGNGWEEWQGPVWTPSVPCDAPWPPYRSHGCHRGWWGCHVGCHHGCHC